MNLETTMTLDGFERWLSRLSMLGIVSAILWVPMIVLLSENRIFLGAVAVFAICIGLMLRRALRRLRTQSSAAFVLIERSFHLAIASDLVGLVYFCWTSPEVLASAIGIAFVAMNLVIAACFLWYVWGIINHFKNALAPL
jgi:hypothetical protein